MIIAETVVGNSDVGQFQRRRRQSIVWDRVTGLFSVTAVGAWFGALLGAYTQSCGWLASPPPFSLTT
jgi:hypothetical protein